MKNAGAYIGVDLGGSTTKLGFVDNKGKLLEERIFSTRIDEGPANEMDEIINLVRCFEQDFKDYEINGVGLGIPGILDESRSLLIDAANFPGWGDYNFRNYLEEKLDKPVFVENDANVAALAEKWYGAGKGQKNIFLITLGTGIGGGIILNERLHLNGCTAEFGHTIIDLNGHQCKCGRTGCLETFFSKKGLSRLAESMKSNYPQSRLAGLSAVSPLELSMAAAQGDPLAKAVYQKAGEALGVAIANVANLFGIDFFVIGGGVSKAWDYFYPAAVNQARKLAFGNISDKIIIKKAAFGEKAGVYGAAALVEKKLAPNLYALN